MQCTVANRDKRINYFDEKSESIKAKKDFNNVKDPSMLIIVKYFYIVICIIYRAILFIFHSYTDQAYRIILLSYYII